MIRNICSIAIIVFVLPFVFVAAVAFHFFAVGELKEIVDELDILVRP